MSNSSRTLGRGSDARRLLLSEILQKWSSAAARAAVVGSALILAWSTWAHWGSIQIDCGRELYVPLQILRGKVLYRDIWYPYGPLEPYAAAALLRIFGQHFNTFYLFGLTIAVISGLLLLEIGTMLAWRAIGLTAAFAFLLQGFGTSLFNYIFPYSYAATLGQLLALLCLFFTLRHVLGRPGRNLMLAGFAAGLALLCKQESGAACYVMLASILAIETARQRSAWVLFDYVVNCAPGVLIAAAIYGWFFWKLGPTFVFDNWVGPDHYFTRTYASKLYSASGFEFSPARMTMLIFGGVGAAFLWFLIAKLAWRLKRVWWRSALAAVGVVGLVAARSFAPITLYLLLAVLVFPLSMFFIVGAFLAYTLYKLRNQIPWQRRLLAEAALAILALALGIRVLANVVPFSYAIFCDAPLLLVYLIVIARCVDAAMPSLAAGQRRKLTSLLLAVEVFTLAITLIPGQDRRNARLDSSWGEIYLQPAEATVTRQIMDFVSEQKQQGRRVVLLPELPMLYALTGTEAPSRLYTLQPGFLPPWQEDSYIADLKLADPACIVLTNRTTPEYGVPYFGIDYDQKVYRWIEANYRVAGEFGRFRRDGSRILTALLYRRSRPQAENGVESAIRSDNRDRRRVESGAR